MHKLMRAGILTLALAAAANLGLAKENQSREKAAVAKVDAANMTFTCHLATGDLTYKATDQTVFRIGNRAATFADLQAGQTILVTYHAADKGLVADRVTITAQ